MKYMKAISTAAMGLALALAPVGVAGAGDGDLDGVAPAWLDCRLDWHDENTAGVVCGGGSFFAVAECADGSLVQGAVAAAGTTSYAYCTSVGSSLRHPVGWDAIPA